MTIDISKLIGDAIAQSGAGDEQSQGAPAQPSIADQVAAGVQKAFAGMAPQQPAAPAASGTRQSLSDIVAGQLGGAPSPAPNPRPVSDGGAPGRPTGRDPAEPVWTLSQDEVDRLVDEHGQYQAGRILRQRLSRDMRGRNFYIGPDRGRRNY